MKNKTLPTISVIIPVLNEEENLKKLIPYLLTSAEDPENLEILVVDGGSNDGSAGVAHSSGAVVLKSSIGRACQMNKGAEAARGEVLYFLHADSFPPKGFDIVILQAIRSGIPSGCFRMKFDSPSLFLRFFAWFSRFNLSICRGGDQSLFITRTLFTSLGGYDERYRIYEDNEFVNRIYNKAKFKILPMVLRTSARKYSLNGRFRLQYHFACIHWLYYRGKGPEALYAYYQKNIRQAY